MGKKVLPWESVAGPIYHDCPAKKQASWVRPGAWLFVALLIAGGLVTRYKIALLFAFLYAITLLTQRDNVLTSRGLEIYFDMRITTQYYFWPWQDLFSVTHEEDPRIPHAAALYFTMGDRTKKLFFPRQDLEAILALAKRQNPQIRIYDAADTKAKVAAAQQKKQTQKRKK